MPTEKRLFTPGPLSTSLRVKQAMLRDKGSRDSEFLAVVKLVRERLLALGGSSQAQGFEAIPVQGSGTSAVEAVIGTAVPHGGKLLVAANGAYGERMLEIARVLAIPHAALRFEEDAAVEPGAVERALAGDPAVTHVAVVHCETTTGLVNPIEAIGAAVRRQRRRYVVDSMSGFGALPVDLERFGIDFLVSSANKCIQGVPGFAFALCRRSELLACEGRARSLTLDLLAQWRGLERDGQFRFTPPTHALLAFAEALRELDDEGGVAARGERYRQNQQRLEAGMRALGFRSYLPRELQGPIITSFLYPEDPRFDFGALYQKLAERGFAIYPGKLTRAACFRIGSIGDLFAADIDALLAAMQDVLKELGLR
jgi:2-aminoethylphosphonate-pyruvate transaminase